MHSVYHGVSARANQFAMYNIAKVAKPSYLNFSKEELKVGLTEVKTYCCLYYILDDLLVMLKKWKGTTQHPAYDRYMRLIEGQREEASDLLFGRQLYRLRGEDQNTAMAAVGFLNVFKETQDYDSLVEAMSHTRNRIARIILPAMNELLPKEISLPLEAWDIIWSYLQVDKEHKLRLKTKVKDGDEAVLEDDLITDAFKAAADLVIDIMDITIMFQEDPYMDCEQQKKLVQEDASRVTHMTLNVQHRCSVLTDFLDEGLYGVENYTKLATMLKKGHYRIKELALLSIENRSWGAKGICGQSEGLVVMRREVGLKMVLTVWDTIKRKVAGTVSVCNFGCQDLAAFVLRGELFVVLVANPHRGHFFFFMMRCRIESLSDGEMLGANSWPHPVLAREVATNGTCKGVTFHMLKGDNGDLTCLALFADNDGTQIVFLDPATGEEISRQKLDFEHDGIEAIKDDKAILYEKGSRTFVVCKFEKQNVSVAAKIPMQTTFPELDEKCQYQVYGNTVKAVFDQSDRDSFVLFSPAGDFAFFDSATLKVKFKGRQPFTAFHIPQLDPRLRHPLEPMFGVLSHMEHYRQYSYERALGMKVKGHCLVNEILFYVVRERDTLNLRATDLNEDVTLDLCQFGLGSGCSHNQTQDGGDCGNCSGTNLEGKIKGGSFGHYVHSHFRLNNEPVGYVQISTNSKSSVWTLLAESRYRLVYCHEAKTLYVCSVGDNNFVEVKFLPENANLIKAKQARKQREVQTKWLNRRSNR